MGGVVLACSGAKTGTFTDSSGSFKPGLDFYDNGAGNRGQAALLQSFAANHNVTMVVVSIGGNDFNFAYIIQSYVTDFLGSPSLVEGLLLRRLLGDARRTSPQPMSPLSRRRSPRP